MTVTNVSIAASTCSHLTATATINGQVRTIQVSTAEVASEPEEYRAAFVARIRSFQLENGYTLAQLRANLAGKSFQI
jgi:hypothetical protein